MSCTIPEAGQSRTFAPGLWSNRTLEWQGQSQSLGKLGVEERGASNRLYERRCTHCSKPCETHIVMTHKYLCPSQFQSCHFLVTSCYNEDCCWASLELDVNLIQWWQVYVWRGKDGYRVWFTPVSQAHRPATEFQPLWRWPWKWLKGQGSLLLLMFNSKVCFPFSADILEGLDSP